MMIKHRYFDMSRRTNSFLAAFTFPCVNAQTVGECISGIYTWSLTVVGIVAFVQIFYAGVMYLIAAGDTGKITRAKNKIFKAVLGLILLFSSYLILYTINPDLVGGGFKLPDLGETKTQERYSDEGKDVDKSGNKELSPLPECSDGKDNDNDGKTDFPDDPDCADEESLEAGI